MAVRKIRDSWYIDIRFQRQRIRRRSPDNTKAGAKAYEMLICRKLAKGEPLIDEPEVKMLTFKEFSDKWFSVYVENNNRLSEIRGKRSILDKHLIPAFGKLPLDKISNLKIEEYKSTILKTGLTKKTVNNHLLTLSSCLHKAKEWQEVSDLPNFRKLKLPPQKFDFLSIEESRLLLQHADGDWHDLILLGIRSGMRLGELRGLKWEDVDLIKKELCVCRSIFKSNHIMPPKSNKNRYLPINDELLAMFTDKKDREGYVFKGQTGNNLRNETCRRAMFRICNQAGLRRIGWHVLRHTFASQLVMAGVSLKAVQELLGHSDITTTLRYAHLAPSALHSAVAQLDSIDTGKCGQQMGNNYEILHLGETRKQIILPKVKQKPA